MWNLRKLNLEKQREECWFPGAGGFGGDREMFVIRYKLLRGISSRDLRYSMVTTVTNLLHI